MTIRKREHLAILASKLNFKNMIEIGVRDGTFAEEILSLWPNIGMYYGIDIVIRPKVAKRLTPEYTGKFALKQTTSLAASKNFKPNSIDWLYIDAMHNYCSILEELEAYWPALKCNSIISGHDYLTAKEAEEKHG